MADDEEIGKPWRDDELDAIIADYFAMLADDLAGRPYENTDMDETGRTGIRT
jgi:hypothetical protein